MRIRLTKTKAQQLLRARTAVGVSQYELAEELGWVRSKIKRIEKGEVSSIEESDLLELEAALDVQESATFRGQKSAGNVIYLDKGAKKTAEQVTAFKKDLFKKVRREERHGNYRNQVFFCVTMKVERAPEELIGEVLELDGVIGAIHGVENTQDQDPLRPGDEVVIMLWGSGIAERPGARSSSSA